MADEINMHSLVLMHYSITLTNGSEIESSFDDEPMEVKMGHGDLTEGMELAIFGLKEGDTQTLTLTPEQGFGARDEDNIHSMPLSDFPDELRAETGMMYMFGTPEGDDIPGTVLAVHQDTAEVDFNHPLAGQALVFSVQILGVDNAYAQIQQDS
jgi:FKBP-type peptidyl-prolyl cis-trans isomerase SlpA